MRDVIVQRRNFQMLRRRQLFHLLPPVRKESGAFLPDERCQFIEVIDGFIMWFGVGLSRLARLSGVRFADGAEISFDLVSSPEWMGVAAVGASCQMESAPGSAL